MAHKHHAANIPDLSSAITGIAPSPAKITQHDYIVANPLDLAPVDQILAAAIDAELAILGKNEKLVVLMGENHFMPTHQMAQVGVLNHLVRLDSKRASKGKAQKTMFAFEFPANGIVALARHEYYLTVPENLIEKLHLGDPDERLALQAMCAAVGLNVAAAKSHQRIFQAVLDKNIPALFGDVASNADKTIKMQGRKIQKALKRLKKGSSLSTLWNKTNLTTLSPTGLALRNAVMVDSAIEKAGKEAHQIIVQHSGLAHVFGDKSRGASYGYSLAAQYQQAGCRVLPVFFDNEWFGPELLIGAEALQKHKNAMVIRGLSSKAVSDMYVDEGVFLEELEKAYSGKPCPFKDSSAKPDFTAVRNRLDELIADTAYALRKQGKGGPSP